MALYIHAKAQVAQVAAARRVGPQARATGSAAKPWPWADTHPVARLVAPAQDADVLVLAGASGRTLAFGPGHLDGSAQPGDRGNAVITAHRDTHFRFLRAIAPGDELVVERADGGTPALPHPRRRTSPTTATCTCRATRRCPR